MIDFDKKKVQSSFILGNSMKISKAKEKITMAGKSSSPVLIYGETGTGKELFVQAIHNCSIRKNGPYIVENCAAIPSTLLEGILFGTTKGGFTGAENKKGLFEMAHKGTLYLDELNSMPFEVQAKLLRVVQDGNINRVGDTNIRNIDVKIVTSVNEIPEKLVEDKKIRKDLYYRLNVIRIDIPPLRERKEDIPILVQYFIERNNKRFSGEIEGIDNNVLKYMLSLDWPGNVRELEHVIEAVFNMKTKGIICIEDIESVRTNVYINEFQPLNQFIKKVEADYINQALILCDNNVSKAAKLLKIPRQTLQSKMNRLKEKDH